MDAIGSCVRDTIKKQKKGGEVSKALPTNSGRDFLHEANLDLEHSQVLSLGC